MKHFLKLKRMMKDPTMTKIFLIPTDDKTEEDTEAIEKTHDMPSKNIRKIIIFGVSPDLKVEAQSH